jgi:hypothetical protein
MRAFLIAFFLFGMLCGIISIVSNLLLIALHLWWHFRDWDEDRDIVKAYPELKGRLR